MSIAPTTPTTTPIIVFFEDELSPELLDELLEPLMSGVEVDVILAVLVKDWTELVVMTDWIVWLLLMVEKVVTTTTVRLSGNFVVMTEVTGWLEDDEVIGDVGTATEDSELADDVLAEDVWDVVVDVTNTVEVEVDCDEAETVITDELALDVSADEVSEVEDVLPLLNATLWRFAIAIAMSRLLAETDEAVRKARRSVMASERMVMMASSACRGRLENGWKCLWVGQNAQVACKGA
jgi:hypothetical protein